MDEYQNWFQNHWKTIKSKYFEFLRYPSISADKSYKNDVLNCANFLKKILHDGGMTVSLIETKGNPIVYAEDLSAGKDAKTVLIYGHYDVQPVDPLILWETPPFEPHERNGKIYARGASDNKGQIFYAISAILARIAMGKKFPVNVKICIEGEEESHSYGLSEKLPSLKEQFKADSLIICDFDSGSDGSFYLTLGARGCMALEVCLTGSDKDLHSGQLGGLAYNPNRAMVELLTKLWDENGTIQVDGFYDNVVPISAKEIQTLSFDTTKEDLQRDFAINELGNEKDRSLMESNWLRPTVEINGLYGGYSGEGTKTVIPAKCRAKITCRLVLDQDPMHVYQSLETFFKKNAPQGMLIDVKNHGGVGGYRSSLGGPFVAALERAAKEVTKKPIKYVLSGASIPVAAEFAKILDVDVLGIGYGLATDEIHAPNEHFDQARFEKGFLTVIKMFDYL